MSQEFPHVTRSIGGKDTFEQTTDADQAAVFFETHRKYFEHFAGHSINVRPAPEGLTTFAFDLNTNTIYLTDKFYKLLGYPDEGTSFATHHEIEHFREKLALLKEEKGAEVFKEYLQKMDRRISPHAGAYSVMDNCISDVRQNGAVVASTHSGFDDVEKRLYADVQFPNVDFSQGASRQPLHIQLPYAILNEYRSGRTCIVDERVRKIIGELQHVPLPDGGTCDVLALMTNPNPKAVPMSTRLHLQDGYVWPKVRELLAEDLKEDEENKQQKKGGKGEKGSGEENDSTSDAQSVANNKNNKEAKKNEAGKDTVVRRQNPNEIFKDAYAKAEKRVPNAMPVEAQQEALKKWVEENGDREKKEHKTLAETLGVRVEDVKRYKDIARALHQENPKTHESVIDELEKVIRRIISNRLKENHTPRYPVEEGDDLVDPAGWLAEVQGGNLQPKVWEDTEIKLKKNKKFGEVEITLVCDRSGSMKEEKQREQQKALVLFMEALKRFNDVLDGEETSVEKPLIIKSEIYTFQANTDDGVPIKKMGKALSQKERIESCAKVSTTPGNSTTDFVPLESIQKGLTTETREKIKEGELKKIVIVFTDGGSDDSGRVQTTLNALLKDGVIVIGVGITESGKPAIMTYAPKAVLAEKAEDLPNVLRDILKETLADV